MFLLVDTVNTFFSFCMNKDPVNTMQAVALTAKTISFQWASFITPGLFNWSYVSLLKWRRRRVRQVGNHSETNFRGFSQPLRHETFVFLKLLWNYKCIHLSTCQDMIIGLSKDLHRLWYHSFMKNMQKTCDLADAAVASKRAAALTEFVIIPVWEWWAYRTSDTVQIIHTAVPREFSQRWKTTKRREKKCRRE